MTFTVFALVVFITTAMAFTAVLYFENRFKENISRDQFALLNAVATQIDERIFDALVDLDILADSITPVMIADPGQAQRLLDSWKMHQSFFDNTLFLFSKSGTLIAASPRELNLIGKDYSFRNYFKETVETGKICISPPFDSFQKKSHSLIMFTAPVYDAGGKIIAVVGGGTDLEQQHYFRSLAALKPGQNGFLSLYDTNRTVLVHSDRSRLLQQDPPGTNAMVEKALHGYEGTGETATRTGISVLRSVKHLHSTDWILAISYPLKDAYAPLYTARKYFLFGSIAAALLSVLIVWPLMKYLTAPLIAFTRHLEQLPSMEGAQWLLPIRSNDEIGVMAQAFNQMIIELGRRKNALGEQKEFAESLVLNSALPTFVIDPRHKLHLWNKACEELTGVKAASVVGTDGFSTAFYGQKRLLLADVIVDGSYDTLPLHHMRCSRSNLVTDGWHCEGWYEHTEGLRRYLLLDAAPIYNSKGEAIAAIETIQDITQSKQAELALRESEERYRQLFENNPHPMWVYDLETLAFLAVNNAAVHHYGYSKDEFLAMTIKDIRPPEDIPALLADVARVAEGIDEAGVWRHVTKGGSMIFVEITSHTLQFGGRDAEIVLAHDVTGRIRATEEKEALEQQLRQAQKMEAIGTLAGGIAHDFNNILTAIVGYATLLQRKLGEDNPCNRQVDRILAATERAAGLTHSLLTYSRKQISNPVEVDLNSIITHATHLLRRLVPESIEFRSFLASKKLAIMADSGQIEQVLMNLVTNARDAMPGAGELRITTGLVELDDVFVATHGYGCPGSYALLTVADTGVGMDKRIRERIFEPFFTTKEVGKGTGLGLAMVYGIVKQHNGYVNCYSEPGHGTVFRIYLPLTGVEARESVMPGNAVVPGGSETILLVEDDEAVRELTRDLLEEFGYTVIIAVDGEDGIEKFAAYRDAVQLVILDVIMPKMNGCDVYRNISAMVPDVKAMFVSGYAADVVTDNILIDDGCAVLSKPIAPNELLNKVREILDTCTVR